MFVPPAANFALAIRYMYSEQLNHMMIINMMMVHQCVRDAINSGHFHAGESLNN